MKKVLFAALFAAGSLLFAAENLNYSWSLGNAKGPGGLNKEAPTAEKPLTFTKDPKSKWGPFVRIHLDKAEPGVFYRFRVDCKAEKPEAMAHFDLQNGKGWIGGAFPVNKGPLTMYLTTDSEQKKVWYVSFDGDFGKITVSSITVEKLSPDDLNANLIPNDGLEPGFWRGFWGGGKDVTGVVKDADASPIGKILAFPAGNPEIGYVGAVPLPFVPNRKFELSFWLRSDSTATPVNFQLIGTSLGHTRIGLKKEWAEYKYTGITQEKCAGCGMVFMIFTPIKNNLQAFELGGIDFHYVK